VLYLLAETREEAEFEAALLAEEVDDEWERVQSDHWVSIAYKTPHPSRLVWTGDGVGDAPWERLI
jgi:hypothetical protein